jgi:hypothetical protein
VTTFALAPASAAAAAYGITQEQAQLVQAYLQHLTAAYVVPAFAANVLGPLLGPASGGLVVSRTVGNWLNGARPTSAFCEQLHAVACRPALPTCCLIWCTSI